jgi:hypothetical protein
MLAITDHRMEIRTVVSTTPTTIAAEVDPMAATIEI